MMGRIMKDDDFKVLIPCQSSPTWSCALLPLQQVVMKKFSQAAMTDDELLRSIKASYPRTEPLVGSFFLVGLSGPSMLS